MIKQVLKALPNDRPITALSVIEDASRCPANFAAITKTYDSDSDADLWRESGFFARKITRYLCYSKVEQLANYVVEDIVIINEKELPPEGYGLIPRTLDSDQRAWRKKQICYKLTRKDICTHCITDIIVISRNKRSPDGFIYLGEINNLALYYKVVPAQIAFQAQSPQNGPLPNIVNNAQENNVCNGVSLPYPKLNGEICAGNKQIYENVFSSCKTSSQPTPPPRAPTKIVANNTNTLSSSYHALQGVPFILNPRLEEIPKSLLEPISIMRKKTREELEKQYHFDFDFKKYL